MMRFRNLLVAAGALAALGGMAVPASAVVMTATYEGRVRDSANPVSGVSFDLTGLFGNGDGSSLHDLNFILTFTYDTELAGPPSSVPGGQSLDVGSDHGKPAAVWASLKINGQTVTVNGDKSGQAQVSTPTSGPPLHLVGTVSHSAVDDSVSLPLAHFIRVSFTHNSSTVPASITTPFTYDIGADIGDFLFRTPDPQQPGEFTENTYGRLFATKLTVAEVSAVPLPAALPLYVAGVAGVGLVGWLKRRSSRRAQDAA